MFSLIRKLRKPSLNPLIRRSEEIILNTNTTLLHISSSNLGINHADLEESSSKNHESGELDKLYKLVEVEVRGNDPAVLKSYTWYTKSAANHLGIEVGQSWTPEKPHHERYTVLRSIHVNKKCRVQYEFRTYFQFMQFHRLTGSTADTFLEYIQRNLPEGIAMKVTKIALEKMPDHITPPPLPINKEINMISTS